MLRKCVTLCSLFLFLAGGMGVGAQQSAPKRTAASRRAAARKAAASPSPTPTPAPPVVLVNSGAAEYLSGEVNISVK
jgi:hypothetical protein